ncbi:hypothetical protein HO133_001484 [Letharia lupina]|uniref:Uncharacterized protein n=1 Tax=Letharia lupina TaxID=560253 RepID=A0A8H6CFF6_9LECA|nr:uncharacterized protein HO133_001484 [Letharia lupina]KAF6222398.1 hypothetical protein HO133_001484 [Letharia lupina]
MDRKINRQYLAPKFLEDADDTAKTTLSLNLLGRATPPDRMIAIFEADHHCKTFAWERDPKFSANCNILNALLYAPKWGGYVAQIYKAANILCKLWYQGEVNDKWNPSPQYSKMLLTQALVRMLELWQDGSLNGVCEELFRDRVPIILTQIAIRTL